MKLKIIDRLALSGIVPDKGNFVTISLAQAIRDKVKFTSDEIVAMGIRSDGPNVQWNTAADVGVEVDFSAPETDMIAARLTELNTKNALTADMVGVYRLFTNEGSSNG